MKDQVLTEIVKMINSKVNSKIVSMQDSYLPVEIAQEVLRSYAKNCKDSEIFAQLKSFGLSTYKIVQLINNYDDNALLKAANITHNLMSNGKLQNPAGFFIKLLGEKSPTQPKEETKPLDSDWLQVRQEFIKRCGLDTFNAWLRDVVLVRKGREVELKCKSRFVADYVQRDHAVRLQAFWNKTNREVQSIKFIY